MIYKKLNNEYNNNTLSGNGGFLLQGVFASRAEANKKAGEILYNIDFKIVVLILKF